MSKWPDGFDVSVGYYAVGGWFAYVYDRRPGVAWTHLPGYTTSQEAEGAALDWIQRRVGKPVTVPQPVLRPDATEREINAMLACLMDIENRLPSPLQADYPDEREHIAAADCWIYRCGLIGALRNSLRAELEMIREKL
ncbi:MAG: hypothetical protein ACK6D3_07255 [Planctomycetaceae bacterium]